MFEKELPIYSHIFDSIDEIFISPGFEDHIEKLESIGEEPVDFPECLREGMFATRSIDEICKYIGRSFDMSLELMKIGLSYTSLGKLKENPSIFQYQSKFTVFANRNRIIIFDIPLIENREIGVDLDRTSMANLDYLKRICWIIRKAGENEQSSLVVETIAGEQRQAFLDKLQRFPDANRDYISRTIRYLVGF